ncbi:MAG: SAM-dependent methyltransferase [Verrucomicrobia bacterium]|nr:SAM-dependent methyltransferase [Verrucomicrobiota bacterium]
MSTILIDHQSVPVDSIYGDVQPIAIRPIGHVVAVSNADGGEHSSKISTIRLLPAMARFMSGLEEESSVLVLWYFDRAGSVESVFPRGWDGKRVGPFASRTPHRLTPIGATEVELVEVRGTTLLVRGLEAFEGTPVLDIKVTMQSLREGGRRRTDRRRGGQGDAGSI